MKTVVLLLSDKRSGSTILQNELCRHHDIQHVRYSPHTYFETHHWLKAAVMLEENDAEFSGGVRYPGYGTRANARAYMEDCIVGNIPGYILPANDRALTFEGWEALCTEFAQPVFFEKSPQYLAHPACLNLLMEWVKTTSYKIKVIGLTRNPMSVLYSANQLFFTDPYYRQWSWKDLQQNMLRIRDRLPPDQFIHIRYEDLISDPTRTLNRLFNFIGVSPISEDESSGRAGSTIHGDSVDKWRKDASYTFQLNPVITEFANQFGYSDEELHQEPDRDSEGKHASRWGLLGKWTLFRCRVRDRYWRPLLIRIRNLSRRGN